MQMREFAPQRSSPLLDQFFCRLVVDFNFSQFFLEQNLIDQIDAFSSPSGVIKSGTMIDD